MSKFNIYLYNKGEPAPFCNCLSQGTPFEHITHVDDTNGEKCRYCGHFIFWILLTKGLIKKNTRFFNKKTDEELEQLKKNVFFKRIKREFLNE